MTKCEYYQNAFDILDQLTPLHTDCGDLCSQACCHSVDADAGMYLFPGEEQMYIQKPDWLRIEEAAFTYGDEKPTLIAICTEHCKRELRPLACRIFPLIPYIGHNGILKIKTDPRAVPMCPLAKPYASKKLEEAFITAVKDVFEVLSEDKDIFTFICDLSKLIDEQEREMLHELVKQKKKRRA